MREYYLKTVIRVLAAFSVVLIIPIAVSSPDIVQGHWLIYLGGIAILANIIINEPLHPDEREKDEHD